MSQTKLERTQIHPGVALSCSGWGVWDCWLRDRDPRSWWTFFYASTNQGYLLDFAALRLQDVEAFIVAVAAATGRPIHQFDERAVGEIIRWANANWELE